jgi:hypothetical protein
MEMNLDQSVIVIQTLQQHYSSCTFIYSSCLQDLYLLTFRELLIQIIHCDHEPQDVIQLRFNFKSGDVHRFYAKRPHRFKLLHFSSKCSCAGVY